MMEDFTTIVGMEIHVELKTNSKMFCGCKNDPFHALKPNIYTCPVCLGLPGALPVPNRRAVEWCLMIGLALNCEIPLFSKFDRKNYFYPDLAKGYQISQYDQPFCKNGFLNIKVDGHEKRIGITRVHMEEDTGKLMHATVDGKKVSLVDFNRSGVPLVEIVTEPDIRSSEEARIFLKKLHQIIRYLGVSDANMEQGSMRLEPNISVLKVQSPKFKVQGEAEKFIKNNLPRYKVEVKNINSFSFAKKAIDFEVKRHIDLLEQRETPKQETRGWDEKKNITVSQRSKEEAQDYRYFPEPDIPPVLWTEDYIRQLAEQIPELPDKKIARFIKMYGLTEYDATILTDEVETATYFEKAVQITDTKQKITAKTIANWVINKKVEISKVSPEKLVQLISQKTLVVAIDEKELEGIVKKVIGVNSKAVSDYKAGKEASLMFLLGCVMRETRGKADASTVRKILQKALQ